MDGLVCRSRGVAQALLLAVGLVWPVCGRAEDPGIEPARLIWQQVAVHAMASANQGQATKLDIVVVHDVNLMPRMPTQSAQWFALKPALLDAAGRGLSVTSLEVPPQTSLGPVKLPPGAARAAGALVYVGWTSGAGAMAQPLAPYHCVRFVLDLQVTQQRC